MVQISLRVIKADIRVPVRNAIVNHKCKKARDERVFLVFHDEFYGLFSSDNSKVFSISSIKALASKHIGMFM